MNGAYEPPVPSSASAARVPTDASTPQPDAPHRATAGAYAERVALAHAYQVAVEERITDLWIQRAWWRYHRWADWPDIRQEQTVELRALVAIARRARRVADALPDPVTEAKSYDAWTESEKAQAWGR